MAVALGLTLALLVMTGCDDETTNGALDAFADTDPGACEPGCGVGLLCCPGGDGASLCVDRLSDPQHCGACDVTCGTGEQCQGGACMCPVSGGLWDRCMSGEVCCPDAGCSILSRDPARCGSCDVSCGLGEACADGHCTCARLVAAEGPVCQDGQACCGAPLGCLSVDDPECSCGDSVCGHGEICCTIGSTTICVLTTTNAEHCGGCGIACSEGQRCDTGQCACLPGLGDCDEDLSNGCETGTGVDPLHCGQCGNVCGAAEQCVQGECSCVIDWGDCNVDSTDGCEASLSTDKDNCGQCGNACNSNEECIGGSCNCAPGFADCNMLTTDGCEVDFNTDLNACGICGFTCGANTECVGGDCLCVEGFGDCNRTPADGCEVRLSDDVNHCGLCDGACTAGQECVDGSCGCEPGYGDCNGRSRDGCEAYLVTDVVNCGACERVCAGYAPCTAGSCGCGSGFGDCNGNPDDGCEVDLLSDTNNCGTCVTPCQDGQLCRGGRCTCTFGFADCNEIAADGCEVDLDTNAAHCGSCGRSCGQNQICVGGHCTCEGGFADCNRRSTDGCEAELATDVNHCDACGAACGAGMNCVGGTCECAMSFGDCDGNPSACEADHRTNPNHCGGCNIACGSGRICSAGVCTCAPERADCDGNSNTCETYTPNHLLHCGRCGNACPLTEICEGGACVPALSDLVVTEVTTGGPSVAVNDILLVSNTAQNIGTENCTVSARLGIYLSTDDTITTSDILIRSRSIGILEPLTAVPETVLITIPGWLEPGPYYIGAIVDDAQAQRELDETNNVRLGPAVEVLRDVDLHMSNVIPVQMSLDVGLSVGVTNTIQNLGTTITSTNTIQVGLYLSSDPVITIGDLLLANYTRGALLAGEDSTRITTVTIPKTTAPGTYYIGAIADYANLQVESDETNNALASGPMNLIRNVDLVPVQANTPVSTTPAGTSIPITMTIQNSGTTATTVSSFVTGIYLSSDNTITTADTQLFSRSLSTLGPGEVYSTTPSVLIPSATAPGAYFIGVITDYNDTQPETDETNNALVGSSINVQ